MAKMETVKYTQRKMYVFKPSLQHACFQPSHAFFFATICEEIIPWISVTQSMKELGPKYRFSKILKKSTIGRGKRKRDFITVDLNKNATKIFFPTHTVVKELCHVQKMNAIRNRMGISSVQGITILFSAVSEQCPVYSILHSAGKRRNTANMGSIDKLLKYWNLLQLLRLCWHSLPQGQRSLVGKMRCLCRDAAYKGSSRHSQSLLALCGTCRTSYIWHLSSPKWSSASG